MFYKISMILFFFMINQGYSKIYTSADIRDVELNIDASAFVKGFFTARNPELYISQQINKQKTGVNSLKTEYLLYQLLNQVSYQSEQTYLKTFINRMKTYQADALKWHEEGRMQVPVYNLQAKAKGIENIWQYQASYAKYSQLLNTKPIATLNRLKQDLNSLSQPQWLGLKHSIENIAAQNHVIISDYLMETGNLKSLDKFVAHYALITGNQLLINKALIQVNNKHREFILRSINDYFTEPFIIKTLLKSVDLDLSTQFALSLLKPYVENNTVRDVLIAKLSNKKYSNQAAFSLSSLTDEFGLKLLKNSYKSNQSETLKNGILYAFKLNKSVLAQKYFQELKVDSSHKKWVNSFNGEIR